MIGYRVGKGGTAAVLATLAFAAPSLAPSARALSVVAVGCALCWCWTLARLRVVALQPPYCTAQGDAHA